MSYTTGIEIKKRNKNRKTMEDVLNKTYTIRNRGDAGWLSFPKCMIGKRIKITLVKW